MITVQQLEELLNTPPKYKKCLTELEVRELFKLMEEISQGAVNLIEYKSAQQKAIEYLAKSNQTYFK
jgi:hypothetical protein